MRVVVTVGFFRAEGCSRSCQKYSHVEVRFSDGTVTSITRNPGHVHYDQTRVLSKGNYSCFMSVQVTPKQEEAMQQLAYHHYVNRTPFGSVSMFWNFVCLPCPIRNESSLFCSQYVIKLFQHCGMLLELDPDRTSPTVLFEEMCKNEDFYFSTNAKRSRVNMIVDV